MPRRPDTVCHHGKRLGFPLLARAKPQHRRFVTGIDSEMDAAYAFHRHDPACFQITQGRAQGCFAAGFALTMIDQLRPACRAGIGLRMIAAVHGIAIFLCAVRAHLKLAHGRMTAVIRDIRDDRITRPAVGAVDERIAVTAVRRIIQLAQTVRARRDIRGDHGVSLSCAAFQDLKAAHLRTGQLTAFQRFDAAKRRCFLFQPLQETRDVLLFALNVDERAAAAVAHAAAQRALLGQAMDKGAEAHPLHDAVSADLNVFHPAAEQSVRADARKAHPGLLRFWRSPQRAARPDSRRDSSL